MFKRDEKKFSLKRNTAKETLQNQKTEND